jgi:hypothetical protein
MTKNFCDVCGVQVEPGKVYNPEDGRPHGGWTIPVKDSLSLNPQRPEWRVSWTTLSDVCLDCADAMGYALECLRASKRRPA